MGAAAADVWLLAATVTAAALLTIPGFLNNPRSYNDFVDANAVSTPDPGNFGLMHAAFLTAQRLGVVWTEPSWSRTVTVTSLTMVVITAFVVLVARRRSLFAETALLLLVQIVISFQVWEHHLTAALLSGGLLMLAVLGREADPLAETGPQRGPGLAQAWLLAALVVWLALPRRTRWSIPTRSSGRFPSGCWCSGARPCRCSASTCSTSRGSCVTA